MAIYTREVCKSPFIQTPLSVWEIHNDITQVCPREIHHLDNLWTLVRPTQHLMAIKQYFVVLLIHFIVPISFIRDVIDQGRVPRQQSDRYIIKNAYSVVGYIIKSAQNGQSQSNIIDHQKPKLISPWTRWPPFRRRYFQIHFRE